MYIPEQVVEVDKGAYLPGGHASQVSPNRIKPVEQVWHDDALVQVSQPLGQSNYSVSDK